MRRQLQPKKTKGTSVIANVLKCKAFLKYFLNVCVTTYVFLNDESLLCTDILIQTVNIQCDTKYYKHAINNYGTAQSKLYTPTYQTRVYFSNVLLEARV